MNSESWNPFKYQTIKELFNNDVNQKFSFFRLDILCHKNLQKLFLMCKSTLEEESFKATKKVLKQRLNNGLYRLMIPSESMLKTFSNLSFKS